MALVQRKKTLKKPNVAQDATESGEESLSEEELCESERVALNLEQEFIQRLEELQDVNKLDKDERLMRMLGITKE